MVDSRASALVHTLCGLSGGSGRQDARVVSYESRQEFMRLWGANGTADSGARMAGLRGVVQDLAQAGVKTLVVVWDGTPNLTTGPVDTTRYLTPLDWVMALACELESDDGDLRGLSVWILPLQSIGGVVSETEEFVNSLPRGQIPGVPWAHVCRMASDGDDPNGPQALVAALSGRKSATAATRVWRTWFRRRALRSTPAALMGTLLPAKGVWTSALTRPSADASHHDVANLLGPQRLLAEPGSSESSLRDAAPLRQLAQSLGLFPRDREHGDERLGDGLGWLPDDVDWHGLLRGAKRQRDKISVCLVDDMWRMGWGDVLCRALGADSHDGDEASLGSFCRIGQNAHFRVFSTGTADAVVTSLHAGKDLRFAFTLLGPPTTTELIVLDLRLFEGRPLADEATFFVGLVEVARGRAEGGDLPWPAIEEEELDRIKSWCDAVADGSQTSRENVAYVEGMTLLPRLIALADPAYPVIVFSSTGRRVVAEKFRAYGNVITTFEKPQASGLGAQDLASRVASGFRKAMREALELLAVRRECRRLPPPRSASEIRAMRIDEAPAERTGDWTVEVFLDETGGDGRNPLTVGGLTVVYPPGSRPENLEQVSWTRELAKLQREDCKGKFKERLRKTIRQVARGVEGVARDGGIKIAAVAICGDPKHARPAHGDDKLFNERQHDNLHRELVRAVLEGAVYEVSRQLVPNGSETQSVVHLEVRLATRVTRFPRFTTPAQGDRYRTRLWEDLGIATFHPGPDNSLELIDFMNEGAARPLVEEVMQRYPEPTCRFVPRVAVAVRLNASTTRRPPAWHPVFHRARFLHYVADALLSNPCDVPDEWWRRGFGKPPAREKPSHKYAWTSRYGKPLTSLLEAQRYLLANVPSEALVAAIGHDPGREHSLELRIQYRLREAIATLSGRDIQEIRDSLRVVLRQAPLP